MAANRILVEASRDSYPGSVRTPLWYQIASRLLFLIAAVLFLVSLGTRVYASDLIVAAFAAVCLAQGCAAFLYARAWIEEQQRVRETKRELHSIFDHVLDGILILDDRGVCVDANPAAFVILGAPPAVLIGRCFAQFYKNPQLFEERWRNFLAESFQHGQTELIRRDGRKIVANFTVTANYLPGKHAMILCDITERVEAQDSAREFETLYQQMADSIDEVFWLMDASTKKVLAVNRAYETVTGRTLESISTNPSSYVELIHPADRVRVLAKLDHAVQSGHFDEEFRIVRRSGEIRWVWVKGSAVRSSDRVVRQLYGTALDITAKKLAEAKVAEHLVAAEAARAEAEALRKATLALTQNLRMDAVLDTLLETLHSIVPNDRSSVLLAEEEGRLFVARARPARVASHPVVTLDKNVNAILEEVVVLKKSVYLPDVNAEGNWRDHRAFSGIRSWLAVPLVVSDSLLGVLSIGSRHLRAFSAEQVRLAKLLAIPAAVAIHNARLYEWAQIYAAERQTLLRKLDETPTTQENGASSGRRFTN